LADLSQTSVIFDLDGTLIDSAAQIHATTNRVLHRHGLGITDASTVQSFVGNGLPKLVERLLHHHQVDTNPALLATIITQFEADYTTSHDLTKLYPGVRHALETLKTMGALLGLCTNKPIAPTLAILHHLNLTPLFHTILGGDSLPIRKPDPEHLWTTARDMNRPKVIFVGDSEVDADTAQAAKIPFLLYTEGYRKSPAAQIPHHAAFDNWAALPDLIAPLA